MKMLPVSLVVVLLISGKYAFRVDLQDYGVEQSNEIQNIDSDVEVLEKSVDEVQFNSENESEEFEMEPIKRSKKAYNLSPCDLCGFNGNQYANRPFMGYTEPQYRPNFGFNNHNLYPKPAHHQLPPPVYAPPIYNAPSHPQPHYNYNNNNKYSAPVYPAPSSYPNQHTGRKFPSSNLLIGCNLHVSPVPALNYPSNYDNSPYDPPHSHIPMAYRFDSNEDSVHSASRNPENSNDMPEKISLFDDHSSSKTKTPSSQSLSTTHYSENTELNNKKEEKTQQPETQPKPYDTLHKFASDKLSSKISVVGSQKPEPAAGKNEQVKKT